jgi:hypothetical protein
MILGMHTPKIIKWYPWQFLILEKKNSKIEAYSLKHCDQNKRVQPLK